MRVVLAKRCAISTSGEDPITRLDPWCSDTQKRWYPHVSAFWASSMVCRNASVAVSVSCTGLWSKILSFKRTGYSPVQLCLSDGQCYRICLRHHPPPCRQYDNVERRRIANAALVLQV